MERILPTDEELMQMGKKYQEGEDYPKEARDAEDDHIYSRITEIVEECKKNNLEGDGYVSLEDYIGIYRGTWQVRYGFYRSSGFVEALEKGESSAIYKLAESILGEKAKSWMDLPNDNFGGFAPSELITLGKGHKVRRFLNATKEGY